MSAEFLSSVLILLFLSVTVVSIGLKFKVPAIIGFLLTGVLVGPHILKIFQDAELIDNLAELGVVLLLFTIGLDFSISSLLRIKKTILLGGGLQVSFCILITLLVMHFLGFSWNTALLFGFLFSLSSSAIVLKLFQEQGNMNSVYGQSSLAVLIFQDLAVVPMVLILPLLGGSSEGGESFIWIILKALLFVAFILFMAVKVVPKILKKVSLTKSRELFMFTVSLICLGTAFLTYKIGLSLALGAFVAGLLISSSPYVYQALGSILPIRDIFTSFFFVSIGMMLDLNYFSVHPLLTIGAALGIMFVNIIAATIAMRFVGLNWRLSIMVAFALCQIGEFSFVLAKEGRNLDLLSPEYMALFLNAAVLTMALTPVAIFVGEKFSYKAQKAENLLTENKKAVDKHGHVIIVGYGVIGHAVSKACQFANIPYKISELNPLTVKKYKERNEPIVYGDAVNEAVLLHLNILEARVLVIGILDPISIRRIIVTAKILNPDIYIVVRSKFVSDVDELIELGADEIVPEEYETALALFEIISAKFMVPEEKIQFQIDKVRAGGYVLFRSRSSQVYRNNINFKDTETNLELISTSVEKFSKAENFAVKNFLEKYSNLSFRIILLKKGKKVFQNPDVEVLENNNIVVLFLEDPNKMPEVLALFRPQQVTEEV